MLHWYKFPVCQLGKTLCFQAVQARSFRHMNVEQGIKTCYPVLPLKSFLTVSKLKKPHPLLRSGSSGGKEHIQWNHQTRYEQHPEVPLGIKAVVCAIYEPPQESSKDTLRILPDPNDEIVEEAASKMGLRKVGWIFTDLVPSATTANKVEWKIKWFFIHLAFTRCDISEEWIPTSFQLRWLFNNVQQCCCLQIPLMTWTKCCDYNSGYPLPPQLKWFTILHVFELHLFSYFSDIDRMFMIITQEIITAGHYQNLYPNPCKHVSNSATPTSATPCSDVDVISNFSDWGGGVWVQVCHCLHHWQQGLWGRDGRVPGQIVHLL